jgi:hypothetical protein
MTDSQTLVSTFLTILFDLFSMKEIFHQQA